MDGTSADLFGYFFTQGILGVACIVMGFIIIKFYNKIERLEKEKYDILEARRVEDKATNKEVLSVLSDNSQNIAILSEKIAVGKREGSIR